MSESSRFKRKPTSGRLAFTNGAARSLDLISAQPTLCVMSSAKPITPDTRAIWREGLWLNNAGLAQLLGLCPLLAVSSTVSSALGLALATLVTLVVSSSLVCLSRRWVRTEIRIAVFVMIIATTVSSIEMLMQAFAFSLYQTLGIFVPLIVTNCAILGRAEAFASRQPLPATLHDALATGIGFGALLLIMGAIREALGHGSLFRNMDQLLGQWASGWTLQLTDPATGGFLLALLPPGAFLILGGLIAARNLINARQAKARHRPVSSESQPTTEVA